MIAAWGLQALAWVRGYWRELGCAAGVVFLYLYIRQGGELTACEASLATAGAAIAAQAQQYQELGGHLTATAKARGSVRIAAGPSRPCPPAGECPPCPEINLDFSSEAATASALKATQAQGLSATASVTPQKPASAGWGGVFLTAGHGWAGDFLAGDPRAGIGVRLKDFHVEGGRSLGGAWQVEAGYQVFTFK